MLCNGLFKSDKAIYTCVKWFQWGQYVLFAISMAVILYTLCFCMETVLYCFNLGVRLNDFNFYVMGKKYMLSLLSTILVLCNRVESSKITSYLELF